MRAIMVAIVMMYVYMSYAQVGVGLTVSNDLYHYYLNPKGGSGTSGDSRSAGSALLNLGVGPKIWFGGDDFSMSVEAQATMGFFGLSAADYKGMGTAAIPIMAKFNFGGVTALDKEGRVGWSIGGGLQYTHTEVYYLSDDFEAAGGTRSWFRTYVGQVGFGFGMSGFALQAFVRGGYNPDTEACVASVGFQYDFNLRKLKEIDDPASRL